MANMRLVTFVSGGDAPRPGIVTSNDTVLDLSPLGFSSLLALIEGGSEALAKAENYFFDSPAPPNFR